ncbi:hypothetical protein DYB37_006782 [Aphanomyces astaci]|uniref:Replication factor-A protein 1 N-terminal domain-containing protein n=1 Tax=Aphanomyces astaci TaxID=112090 RepID=A0A3R7BC87_APHAT|nr:hypothetical protein DYB37_006782 [Aphanomyces astaci]
MCVGDAADVMSITTDAVASLYTNPAATLHPCLQVIHVKEIQEGVSSPHCVVVLSDGTYCISGLVAPEVLMAEGSCNRIMHACCLVQLVSYTPKFVAGNLIIVVDRLVHVACASTRIGLAHPTFFNVAPSSMSALLQAQLDLLQFKQHQQDSFLASVRQNARAAADMITLNVGGQREYFIDVDPIHFDRVMAHLRTGDALSYDGLSLWETLQLRKTVRYLGLELHCTTTTEFMEHMTSLKAPSPSSAA